MISFEDFEKTQRGDLPHRLLDSHPDGKYLAMQTGTGPESAVWEKETKRIAWAPSDAIALSWLRDGTQIAVLREASASPYEFAIYSWPEKQLLQNCPVSPGGWPVDCIISPQNDLAVCQWVDDSDDGFDYIDITSQGVSQDLQASYFIKGPNNVTHPAFSPDGQLWVYCYKPFTHDLWWVDDPEDLNPYQPARGGEYPFGELVVFRGKQPLHTIPLVATVPAGWLPADPDATEALFIADPVFLDAHHVQVKLPSGEIQVHQVPIG